MQQHSTIVNTGYAAPPVYVARPYQTAAVVSAYRGRQSVVIGILLIMAGALSVIFNIVDLAVGTSWNHHHTLLSEYSNGVVGHGIWCGSLMIVAGALGIPAGRSKSRCMIVAFMVTAIIGCVAAGIQALVAGFGANRVFNFYRLYNDYYLTGCNYGNWCDGVKAVFAMEILLAVCGTAGFFLCIWGSILGCNTGDCCGTTQPVAVIPAGQQQVTVVSQQQQQQPMSYSYSMSQPAAQGAYPGYSQTQVDPAQPVQPPEYPGYGAK